MKGIHEKKRPHECCYMKNAKVFTVVVLAPIETLWHFQKALVEQKHPTFGVKKGSTF